MPDSKITALTSISTSTDPANDPLVIVDVSDTSMAATGTTKKVTLNQLLGASGTATLASATITGDLTVRTTGLVVGSTATGIGTTPNTWSGAWKAAQVGRLTLGNATTDSLIGHNFYNDGSYRFAANDFASYYDQVGGAHIWGSSVTSGTAGNAIGWTVLATLNSTGLGVGIVPSSFGRFSVQGTAVSAGILGMNTDATRCDIQSYNVPLAINRAGNNITMCEGGGNVGVGGSPGAKMDVQGAAIFSRVRSTGTTYNGFRAQNDNGSIYVGVDDATGTFYGTANIRAIYADGAYPLGIYTNAVERLRIDSSGNLGLGVTPSAWATSASRKAIQLSTAGSISAQDTGTAPYTFVASNWVSTATGDQYILGAAAPATLYRQFNGTHSWFNAPSGTGALTFTQAMTLDASGNLLVGTTSSVGKFNLTQTANANAVCVNGNVGNFLNFYGWSADSTWNTNATAIFVGKNTSTSRSINAGGTVNASGADYAEYMTKAGDFVLAKGDIAGVDTNGKLTNVFADAVSFVVKSTDPSYVGNDKWGIGLEGDALEAARQIVDRIAFAGQVPVNVTGAKAGDYIVPVVDGTGIKGIAVSNPTFEQYQLAVGKVIAIDADGRARIIVKVA